MQGLHARATCKGYMQGREGLCKGKRLHTNKAALAYWCCCCVWCFHFLAKMVRGKSKVGQNGICTPDHVSGDYLLLCIHTYTRTHTNTIIRVRFNTKQTNNTHTQTQPNNHTRTCKCPNAVRTWYFRIAPAYAESPPARCHLYKHLKHSLTNCWKSHYWNCACCTMGTPQALFWSVLKHCWKRVSKSVRAARWQRLKHCFGLF